MTLRKLVLPLLALIVLASTPALAQDESVNTGQGFGEFYVSAAPDRYEPVIDLPVNVPTPIYLLASVDYAALGLPALNETNGIGAWEAQVTLPTGVFVLSVVYNPTTSLNIFSPAPPALQFSVGTGSLIPAENGLTVLATITALSSSEISSQDVTVAPAAQASLPGEVVWVDYEPVGGECFTPSGPITCIRPFAVLGNAIVNPEPVSDAAESFGGLKSRF